MATINKGFIKDWSDNILLPITRGELVLDSNGIIAFHSEQFLATSEHPGLMTSAEKAMLTGSLGEGGNISDLYNKIGYINNGLKVGNTILNYYDTDNKSTPITFATSDPLSVIVANNVITFGLSALTTNGITESNIVKGITIDKYGRVTSVTAGKLQDADIPTELENKKLTGCTTEAVGTNEYSIVNKSYVDSRITEITGVATGALKFGGAISEQSKAGTLKEEYNYHYFKAVGNFTVLKSELHALNSDISTDIQVKAGDTLIVYEQKFIYVPSGDDITSLTIKDSLDNNALESVIGEITLNFNYPLYVDNPTIGSKFANINIKQVSEEQDGYLSKDDYKEFKSYSAQGAITYTPIVTSSTSGNYQIGTLKIKETPYTIYGINNISSLNLNDTTLVFKETGNTETTTSITYTGGNGISVQKETDKNNIIVSSKNEVLSGYSDYLQIINNYQFGIKLGKLNEDNTITEGLVNFSTIHRLAQQVATTSKFFIITNSLNDNSSTDYYYYGGDKLKAAINVEI